MKEYRAKYALTKSNKKTHEHAGFHVALKMLNFDPKKELKPSKKQLANSETKNQQTARKSSADYTSRIFRNSKSLKNTRDTESAHQLSEAAPHAAQAAISPSSNSK